MSSKIAIAAVLCFFPVMVNTIEGLTSVHPSAIELMHSYAAGEVAVFRRVRIPNSLPYMFSGLKVASRTRHDRRHRGRVLRRAPTNALGVQILSWIGMFDFPRAWAGIVLASLYGIVLYGLVALAEHYAYAGIPRYARFERSRGRDGRRRGHGTEGERKG